MQIRCPRENARAVFSDFSTLRPGFKKVHLQGLCLQDPCGRLAKTMQNMCIYTQKRFHVDGPLIYQTCGLVVVQMIYRTCHSYGVSRQAMNSGGCFKHVVAYCTFA